MNHLNVTLSGSLGALQSTLQQVTVNSASGGAIEVAAATATDVQDEAALLMPPWGYTVTAIILFFIGFFGFFFNLIVIVLMCKDIQLWTPINIILLNLVCSDFSVSIFGNPFTFASAIYRHWMFGRPLCIFYGYFMSLLGITSIATLTVLSYERFCLVCRPLSARQSGNQSSYLTVLCIWTYSFLLTTPPIFGWGQYVVEVPNISCSVNWDSHDANATSYIVYLFIFGLIVPLVVILYSYINIIRTMKQSAVRMGQVNKAESKVTLMVGLMIILFMVAWTPYSIFALMEQFGPGVNPSFAVIPALMAKSSICYNPIIYVALNSQYRAAWSRFWSGGGSGETGLKSGLDTTVNKISCKLSNEIEVLKGKQRKCQSRNLTVVEEVSLVETNTNLKESQEGSSEKQQQPEQTQNNKTIVNKSTAVQFVVFDEMAMAMMTKDKDGSENSPAETQRPRQLLVSLVDDSNSAVVSPRSPV